MPAFDDDDDRDLAGSQDGSSDNDMDETMRDADDADAEAEGDEDVDGDGEADDDGASQSGASQNSDTYNGSGEQPSATQDDSQTTPEEQALARNTPTLPDVRPEALSASTYDIVPTIAAPQSTSINAITATADTRWVFSGGSDGYIRRFNWVDSVNSKLMLTVAQRHPFVDSVVKAGVLMTYWENWDRPRNPQSSGGGQILSPVYALAVQNQGLWLLSGTDSGAIRLQSIRHDEGKEIALLQKHTSAVSVLTLSSDERSLLSGSWDKAVLDWDLNVGKVRTTFASGTGQISAIESRPMSSVPVPLESGEQPVLNGTFSSNNHATFEDTNMSNGVHSREHSLPLQNNPQPGGTPDSLFGGDEGDDDLFGDSGGGLMSNGAPLPDAFGENDEPPDAAPPADALDRDVPPFVDGGQPVQPPGASLTENEISAGTVLNGASQEVTSDMPNGLPHGENAELGDDDGIQEEQQEKLPSSDSTFLATSIDGTIRVWDRRQSNPIARILPRNTPPWCLSACWSPDGNNIYAGRRNGTVDEYDLRKGLKGPERVFKFPNVSAGSSSVYAVKAMPNGRHLICASHDILRLYDLKQPVTARSTVPFLIVPGHRTGAISQLYLDPACRFMISTGGTRGWEGQSSTEVLLGYEIGVPS